MALSLARPLGQPSLSGNAHIANGSHPDGFEETADCCFVVQGVDLRVHSQILSFHSPVFTELFAMTDSTHGGSGSSGRVLSKDKEIKLSSSLEGVRLDAMQLLLNYVYAKCHRDYAKSLTNTQLEAVAPLADRFGVTGFLADADQLLHDRVRLGCKPAAVAESSLEWAMVAERCRLPRLQAKCEAFLAGNFDALKGHLQMQALSKEAWARLMYASHYTGPHCMETMLRKWIESGSPPYPSNFVSARTPIEWDFRGMEI